MKGYDTTIFEILSVFCTVRQKSNVSVSRMIVTTVTVYTERVENLVILDLVSLLVNNSRFIRLSRLHEVDL